MTPTRRTTAEANAYYAKVSAYSAWFHATKFKDADEDCADCDGTGEVGDPFNPFNCACVEKSPEEKAQFLAANPQPEYPW